MMIDGAFDDTEQARRSWSICQLRRVSCGRQMPSWSEASLAPGMTLRTPSAASTLKLNSVLRLRRDATGRRAVLLI